MTIAGEMRSPPWTSMDVRTEPDLAFHQVFRHDRCLGVKCNRNALAGPAGLGDGGRSATSRRPPGGLPPAGPGAELSTPGRRLRRGLPPGRRAVGLSTGCRTGPVVRKSPGSVVRQSFVRTPTSSAKRREPPTSVNAAHGRSRRIVAGGGPTSIRSASTSERRTTAESGSCADQGRPRRPTTG